MDHDVYSKFCSYKLQKNIITDIVKYTNMCAWHVIDNDVGLQTICRDSYCSNVVEKIHVGSVSTDVGQLEQRVEFEADSVASVTTLQLSTGTRTCRLVYHNDVRHL